MVKIGSLLDMLHNNHKCEFVVEQLLIPTFKVLELEFMFEIVSPNST